jgi:hypothetical protein
MLNGIGLAQECLAEVVETTHYLVNISPSLAVVDMNPHEICFGNNPSLSNLIVFFL